MNRRHFHKATIAIATLASTLSLHQAQAQPYYPSRPVTLVVPYQAGGGTDILTRLVAQHLQAHWNQSVIVDNKPGGAGAIGANHVSRAKPDGHTVMIGIAGMMMMPFLTEGTTFDLLRDFAPVTKLASTPAVFTVSTKSDATTLTEFVQQAQAAPQRFSMGNWGVGSLPHLQAEQFTRQIGTPDIVQVSYSGAAPLITNIIGGQLSAAFVDFGSLRPHLGSVRALAVTGTARMPDLPNVPTMAEIGYSGFESTGWWGIFVPVSTPDSIVTQLAEDVRHVLNIPILRERIQDMGLLVGGNASDAFATDIRREIDTYAKLIHDIGLTPNPKSP